MCMIPLKSKELFMTMIRQESINLRSFPATIALERAEAQKTLGKFYMGASAPAVMKASPDDFESFPVIEWDNDDEGNTFQMRPWSHFDALAGAECQSSIARKSHKRLKVASDSFTSCVGPEKLNGMIRSPRIPLTLQQLDDQAERMSSPCTPTSTRSLGVPSKLSFFTTTTDVNLEKMLQISFCSDESNQVMLVA